MKVAIYANVPVISGSYAGGTTTYLGALIAALGRLTDGPEDYVVLGPEQHGEWLESLCGPNQTVVKLRSIAPHSMHVTPPLLGRVARKVIRTIRKVGRLTERPNEEDSLASLQPHAVWSECAGPGGVIPLSSGFIESLGPAVVHFPYQNFVITSIPSIYNPHDLQHLHLPQFFSPELLFTRELSYPFACKLASSVAVCSDWIAQDIFDQYHVPRSKISVIPWGAATARFSAPNDVEMHAVREKHKLDREYIFYPAVVWGHKNHGRLIQALKILRLRGVDIQLVLSGAGTQESIILLNAISKAGVGGAVRLLGYVPSTEMRSLTRAALAVVVPSLYEAASGPVAEAWQDDTPVACSDIPQLREQAEGAAMFFDPYAPDSIADAVQALISDRALNQRLVLAGRAKLSALNWNQTAERYRSLYRDVAMKAGTSVVSI